MLCNNVQRAICEVYNQKILLTRRNFSEHVFQDITLTPQVGSGEGGVVSDASDQAF